MKTNQEMKNRALDALSGNWGKAVLMSLILWLLVCVLAGASEGPAIAGTLTGNMASVFQTLGASLGVFLLSIFFVYPLEVGMNNSCRALLENADNALTGNMFHFGFNRYFHIVGGYFVMYLKIILWTMLFIIPGLIMSFAYAMTPYILVDMPDVLASDASSLSRKMMKGHKWRLFCLCLSFIGWALLCILTLGIGFLWLIPYMSTTLAAFYDEVKAEYIANESAEPIA